MDTEQGFAIFACPLIAWQVGFFNDQQVKVASSVSFAASMRTKQHNGDRISRCNNTANNIIQEFFSIIIAGHISFPVSVTFPFSLFPLLFLGY